VSPKRSPGDGTIFKRNSDGLWVGGIEVPTTDGTRKQKRVTAKNRNDVVKKLRELRKQIDAGTIPGTGAMKVSKWMDHWITTIRGPKLRPLALVSYSNTIRLYVNPTIGEKRLDRLTMADVRQMHTTLQETSTRNAQKAHQVLQQALKDAKREGYLSRNVAEDVGAPDHLAAEQVAFTANASKLIIAAAYASGDEMWATRWATGFLTGARESEVLGLTWDRVHFDIRRIDISWQLQNLPATHGCGPKVDGKYPCGRKRAGFCTKPIWKFNPGFEHRHLERGLYLTRPKTVRGKRMVPILPPLAERLEHLKAIQPNPYGLVFHRPNGKPFTQGEDQRKWQELLKSVGVDHVRQHTMRHSTATLLMEMGVDARIIQEVLGHTNVTTTNAYLHVDLSLAEIQMSPLGELMG
jgi:integrase